MTSVLEEAKALEGDIIADRRWLHEHPEIGFDLPQTTAYVAERLREIGLEPEEIVPGGLVATIGDPSAGRCFMLRADMDCPSRRRRGCPSPPRPTTCTPAGTTRTPPCCWAPPAS